MGRLTVAGRTFTKTTLTCAKAELTGERIACPAGVLELGEKIPVSFSYLTGPRELSVESRSAADETWRLSARFGSQPALLELEMKNARVNRLAPWLPPAIPKISAGRASGTFSKRGDAIAARVELDGFAFATEALTNLAREAVELQIADHALGERVAGADMDAEAEREVAVGAAAVWGGRGSGAGSDCGALATSWICRADRWQRASARVSCSASIGRTGETR